MQVILIRHPQPLVDPGICYGRLDLPLSHEGEASIADMLVHPALADVTRIWSSPAARCRAVAEAIGKRLDAMRMYDDRLAELDFGDWEGLPWSNIDRAELDRWAAMPISFRPPRGESGEALVRRIQAFFRDLDEDGQDVAVVSHGGPLKVLRALLRGETPDLLVRSPAWGTIEVIRDSFPCRPRP